MYVSRAVRFNHTVVELGPSYRYAPTVPKGFVVLLEMEVSMSGSQCRGPRYYVRWYEGTSCPRTPRSYLASVLWREQGGEYCLYLSEVREFHCTEPIRYEVRDGARWVLPLKEDPWRAHPDFCLDEMIPMPRLQTQSHELVYFRRSNETLIYVERSFLDD